MKYLGCFNITNSIFIWGTVLIFLRNFLTWREKWGLHHHEQSLSCFGSYFPISKNRFSDIRKYKSIFLISKFYFLKLRIRNGDIKKWFSDIKKFKSLISDKQATSIYWYKNFEFMILKKSTLFSNITNWSYSWYQKMIFWYQTFTNYFFISRSGILTPQMLHAKFG